MLKSFFADVQKQFADRRKYRNALREIDKLTTRDLVDMRGDWAEMRLQAWQSVYGPSRG